MGSNPKKKAKDSVSERLIHLYRVDIDARAVFERAIPLLEEGYLRKHLLNYLNDHHAHLEHFRSEFEDRGIETPSPSQDVKGRLYEALTLLASAGGEDKVLKALKLSEKMVHQEYKKALEEYWPDHLYVLIHKHWEDELRHLHFFDGAIEEPAAKKAPREDDQENDLGWDPAGAV